MTVVNCFFFLFFFFFGSKAGFRLLYFRYKQCTAGVADVFSPFCASRILKNAVDSNKRKPVNQIYSFICKL